MKRIYMDNAATTRVTQPVLEAMTPCLTDVYGNPSSVHSFGRDARRLLDTVASRHLKMILDPANLFLPGTARPENVRPTLRHAFDLFGGDIVLAHGKDIHAGDGIDFCATGEGIVDYPYLAALLSEIGFTGDMMLHGIYEEEKFASARRFWESVRA